MSNRVCAWCYSEIADEPTVLFCDRYCCEKYLNDHDDVPEEPEYA
jgi:hypothetical protein